MSDKPPDKLPVQPAGNRRRMLILDFDGVVADTEAIHFAAWSQAFAELLAIRIPGDHKQLVGLSLEQIFHLWSADLTPQQKDLVFARKTDLYFEIAADRLQPMPGTLDLIHRAQAAGWYVVIASRGFRLRVIRTLELMRVPALFDAVLGAEDIIDPETDWKDHARVARMFAVDPAACVVIEDSVTGVRDALACGIGCVIGLTTNLDVATLTAAGAHQVVTALAAVTLPEDTLPENTP